MNLLKNYKISKDEIENIRIFLNENVTDDMEGISRIGSVEVEVRKKSYNIQELVDNREFTDEEDIKKYVKERLDIQNVNIEVI